MGTKLTAMSHSIHGQEHNAILRWLSPTDYSLQQSNNLDRWQPGTGQWFLNSPELVAWRNTDNKTLLCQGFPGAGKTIMASLVINYLQKTGQNDKIGIAFAYCDLQLWDNQTPQAILANFVKQLVQQLASVPETVKHFHDDHRGKDLSSLSIRSFLEVLQSVISCFTRVFVVVDALDECRDRRELLDSIARVQAEAGVNFLATTRPEDSIEKEMKYLFQINAPIEIRARDEDMVRYINSHLSEIPVLDEENHDLSSEERNNVIENIKSKIIQAANGV